MTAHKKANAVVEGHEIPVTSTYYAILRYITRLNNIINPWSSAPTWGLPDLVHYWPSS